MSEALLDPKEKPLIGDPLRGLVEQLKDAHGDLPDEQLRDVAKHSLDRFAKARIRNFVPVLPGDTLSATYRKPPNDWIGQGGGHSQPLCSAIRIASMRFLVPSLWIADER
jgi:hypothetical protein